MIRNWFKRRAMAHGADDIVRLLATNRRAWRAALARRPKGPRVLIATNVTGFQHASLLEAVLAAALTLRGAEVHLTACDGALPACQRVEQDLVPDPAVLWRDGISRQICRRCMAVGDAHFEPLSLKRHRLSQYITEADRADARDRCARLDRAALCALRTDAGDEVGMQGLAGALRYFATGDLPPGEDADNVLRRFVAAAVLMTCAFDRLLDREQYAAAVFHHGIYVPQGPTGDVLRRRGIRVVNWNPSYRKSTFIFSHGNSYHYTLMNEPTEAWEGMTWSPDHEAAILDYLASRAEATRDWIWFHEKPEHDAGVFARQLGLDLTRPLIGMLSNVSWDAQLHYPANAFENMFDWVFKTFDYFAKRPELQLLLRIHPAEIRGTTPSRQPLLGEIQKRYPELPKNIFVIAPESNVSTYAAMALCSTIIVYGTKMGVELSAVGKPVIVAGEAWIRNKGLTWDAQNQSDYFALLDRLPDMPAMSAEQIQRARMYAYHFFFRRMLPLPFIVPAKGKLYGLDIGDLTELGRGKYPGLDAVCDGILEGAPFVYAAERLGTHA